MPEFLQVTDARKKLLLNTISKGGENVELAYILDKSGFTLEEFHAACKDPSFINTVMEDAIFKNVVPQFGEMIRKLADRAMSDDAAISSKAIDQIMKILGYVSTLDQESEKNKKNESHFQKMGSQQLAQYTKDIFGHIGEMLKSAQAVQTSGKVVNQPKLKNLAPEKKSV